MPIEQGGLALKFEYDLLTSRFKNTDLTRLSIGGMPIISIKTTCLRVSAALMDGMSQRELGILVQSRQLLCTRLHAQTLVLARPKPSGGCTFPVRRGLLVVLTLIQST